MERSTNITIDVPAVLRDCCDGAAELSLPASCLNAALTELELRYPSLHRSVCDETGAVRRHVNLFVNSELVRDPAAFDAELTPGDVVTIFQAVSGG